MVACTIKKVIRCAMCWIINMLGLRKSIVMEMEPDRYDNTEVLLNRMLELGWNKKHKLIIVTYNTDGFSRYGNKVKVVSPPLIKNYNSIWRLVASTFEIASAYIIIDCNNQIEKINKKTIHIYAQHGNPIKSVAGYYNCRKDTDWVIIKSEFWREVVSRERKVPCDKLVNCGFPRNDCLLTYDGDIHRLFDGNYKKIVAMYPTFRQHKGGKLREGIAIPVIHDIDAAKEINSIAAKHGVLLVVKPHFAQDLRNINEVQLSNIMFITDRFFIDNKLNSYEFLSQTDALITDYSSVFADYIITGKPIALTFEDFEEYRKKPGFAIDTDLLTCCSEMLYTPEDFDRFFGNLEKGIDPYKEKREEIAHLMDDFCDANSTERVINWISTLLQ